MWWGCVQYWYALAVRVEINHLSSLLHLRYSCLILPTKASSPLTSQYIHNTQPHHLPPAPAAAPSCACAAPEPARDFQLFPRGPRRHCESLQSADCAREVGACCVVLCCVAMSCVELCYVVLCCVVLLMLLLRFVRSFAWDCYRRNFFTLI